MVHDISERKKRLISYWSNEFGIARRSFETEGTSLISSSYLNESQEVVVFQTKKRNFILYPDTHKEIFSRFGISIKLIDTEELNLYLSSLPLKQKETDYYFYWMSNAPDDKRVHNLRLLQPSDANALKTLQQSVTDYENELGYVDIEHPVIIGWFSNNRLLGAGSLIAEGCIADIAILTHPEARGQGIGKSIVKALIIEGLKINKLVQYTSMQKNIASVSLAKSLGFERFAIETYWNINLKDVAK